jgi:alcohol dehydrogenase (cytochrome c)
MQRWSFLLLLSTLPMAASARQSVSPKANAFENRCSICHGGDANGGGRAPSILGFIRYHTDAELSDLIHNGRQERGMPAFQIPPDELPGLIVQLRQLAGSTAAMGTAGLTGEGLKRKSGRKPGPGPRPATLKLSSGGVLDGTLMSEDEFSADLLTADGKYYLLSREGGTYREKLIEPKSDWTTYNGDVSGNRYSSLDRINAGNVKQLAVAWLFPTPSSPRIEATPLVVDGVMYLTGWNELYALDATTGQQLWMYRQPHTEGLLSNAGKGANRGAAIAGDKVFMVTDGAHLLAFNRKNGE